MYLGLFIFLSLFGISHEFVMYHSTSLIRNKMISTTNIHIYKNPKDYLNYNSSNNNSYYDDDDELSNEFGSEIENIIKNFVIIYKMSLHNWKQYLTEEDYKYLIQYIENIKK